MTKLSNRLSENFFLQSTLIQVVEYHAQQASLNVDKGNDELEQAKNFKIKATKVNLHFFYSKNAS